MDGVTMLNAGRYRDERDALRRELIATRARLAAVEATLEEMRADRDRFEGLYIQAEAYVHEQQGVPEGGF